jgi:Cu-processing system permease protein
VLAAASVAGFGLAVGLMQVMTPSARAAGAWLDLARFVASAWLLGASFVGMGCLISVATRDTSRAAGLALLAWFGSVIAFDLVLLAVLVVSGGNALERTVFPYLLLFNPVDVFRLVNLTALGGAAGNDVFMAMTAAHAYSPALLYAALVAWALWPFALALAAFRKQEV